MTDAVDLAPISGGTAGAPLRVAYILHRFPYLTETFIAREMYWIQRYNVAVSIFSLMRPKHPPASDEATALADRTRYSRALSWRVLQAQFRFLRRSPVAYLRALAGIVRQTYREPKVMALALALFPKSVLFAAQIEEQQVQHVHAHFVWLEGLTAGVVRELTGVPFTIHPHAFGLFGRNPGNVRREIANANHVVTISDYHRAYITSLCPTVGDSDVSVVRCGVPPALIDQQAPRVPSEPPRILSVGRAVEKKGHEYLVDACALLRDRGLRFECDIVIGGDAGRRALQERIDRHELAALVRLLGAHDQHEVLERYRSSDIFALACVVSADGDRDGIPVVLMEAMASELPVLSTQVSAIPELVEDEVSGLLVRPRDATALAAALERLLTDRELRTRLGRQGREVVRAAFNAEQNAGVLAEVFRRVVSQAASPTRGGTARTYLRSHRVANEKERSSP